MPDRRDQTDERRCDRPVVDLFREGQLPQSGLSGRSRPSSMPSWKIVLAAYIRDSQGRNLSRRKRRPAGSGGGGLSAMDWREKPIPQRAPVCVAGCTVQGADDDRADAQRHVFAHGVEQPWCLGSRQRQARPSSESDRIRARFPSFSSHIALITPKPSATPIPSIQQKYHIVVSSIGLKLDGMLPRGRPRRDTAVPMES